MTKRGLYYKLVESQQQLLPSDDGGSLPDRNDDDIQCDSNSMPETSSQSYACPVDNDYQAVKRNSLSSDNSTLKNFKGNNDVSIQKILRMNKPEWVYITLGVIGSVIQGLSTPIYAYVFGEIMGLLDQSLDEDVQQLNNTLAIVSLVTKFMIFVIL